MASRIPLGRSALYDVLVVPVRSFDLERESRTDVDRRLPRAPRRHLWPLISRPTAGAAPLPVEEALGFDSPVGQPSGTSSSALPKVCSSLAKPRTQPLPMRRSRADSARPFHCSRLISRDDLRVRRPSAALSMRACSDALSDVRHTVCEVHGLKS